jgi:hypothetical protein
VLSVFTNLGSVNVCACHNGHFAYTHSHQHQHDVHSHRPRWPSGHGIGAVAAYQNAVPEAVPGLHNPRLQVRRCEYILHCWDHRMYTSHACSPLPAMRQTLGVQPPHHVVPSPPRASTESQTIEQIVTHVLVCFIVAQPRGARHSAR